MRTKWQSSPAFGDSAEKVLKGNRSVGDDRVTFWEILLDLSRRVYPGSHHSVIFIFQLVGNIMRPLADHAGKRLVKPGFCCRPRSGRHFTAAGSAAGSWFLQ